MRTEHQKGGLGARIGALTRPFLRNRAPASDEVTYLLAFDTVDPSPGEAGEAAVRSLIDDLIEDGDWESLADLIEDWDDTRARTPGGASKLHIALDRIAERHAAGIYAADYCTPVPIPAIPPETLALFRQMAANHPDSYALAGIAAYLGMLRCWEERGTGPISDVHDDTEDRIDAAAAQVAALVEPHADRLETSPLLAYLDLRMLAFTCRGEGQFRDSIGRAVRLDPTSAAVSIWVGTYLLPRWFGAAAVFEEELRASLAPSRAHAGFAPYANAYLDAVDQDPSLIGTMDPDLFTEGLDQLARLRGRDPFEIGRLAGDLQRLVGMRRPPGVDRHRFDAILSAVRNAHDDLIRRHLTAYAPSAWASEGAFHDALAAALADEIEPGARFTMGPDGIIRD